LETEGQTLRAGKAELEGRVGDLEPRARREALRRAQVEPVTWAVGRVRNTDKDNRVLHDWATSFRRGDVRYVAFRIELRNNLHDLEDTEYTLWVKYIAPDGSTNRNESTSPPGFTLKQDVSAVRSSDTVRAGSGWGNNNGGTYIAGDHRIEVYLQRKGRPEKRLIGTIPFRLVE
jgi:hypothetical protein